MNEVENLPFKTINVFIERDFLEALVKQILSNLKMLSKEDQKKFNQLFRKYVTVLGFRNPLHAPQPLQIKAYATAFEDKEEVIPFTLSTWAKVQEDLANKVMDWLKAEKWEDLALYREFDDSLGFKNDWPENLELDTLVAKFQEKYPDIEATKDDLSLMLLWVSGRLPIS